MDHFDHDLSSIERFTLPYKPTDNTSWDARFFNLKVGWGQKFQNVLDALLGEVTYRNKSYLDCQTC